MTTWEIPRESTEFVGPVTIALDNVPVDVFELALLPFGTRPLDADFLAPDVVDTSNGILVGPTSTNPAYVALSPGVHKIWARVTDSPEIPVIDNVGTVIIK